MGMFVCSKVEKRAGGKKLYELVSDILSLSPGEYMAFLTMRSYEQQRETGGDDLENVLKELL